MPKRSAPSGQPAEQHATSQAETTEPSTAAPSILALVSEAPLAQHPDGQIWQPFEQNIRHRLRLLQPPTQVQQKVHHGQLSQDAARERD